MITGARSKDFWDMAKDSGTLIENFKEKYDTVQTLDDILDAYLLALDSPDCLGTTRGGNHFTSEAETRQREFDGSRMRFVGDFVKDAVNPQIETTLLAFNIDNLKRVIPSNETVTTGEKTVIREFMNVCKQDYRPSLSWVRELTGNGILIFTIFNYINIAAVDITGEDKNEGEMACTFIGNNDDMFDMHYAPYEIVIYQSATNGDVCVR
jgi:hypothetical protein